MQGPFKAKRVTDFKRLLTDWLNSATARKVRKRRKVRRKRMA